MDYREVTKVASVWWGKGEEINNIYIYIYISLYIYIEREFKLHLM